MESSLLASYGFLERVASLRSLNSSYKLLVYPTSLNVPLRSFLVFEHIHQTSSSVPYLVPPSSSISFRDWWVSFPLVFRSDIEIPGGRRSISMI